MIHYYDFKLSNGERWYLNNEMTLAELKEYISNNQWIKLYSSGTKSIPNGYEFIPMESDIQTCNIAYVNEDIDRPRYIKEEEESKTKKLNIIKEIEKYKFNFRMKLWYYKSTWIIDKDEEEHPMLGYNENFLNRILDRCKKYKCKIIKSEVKQYE
jgi:hypothetical protein